MNPKAELADFSQIFRFQLPILVASTCVGVAGDRLHWGFGVTLLLIVGLQILLVTLRRFKA